MKSVLVIVAIVALVIATVALPVSYVVWIVSSRSTEPDAETLAMVFPITVALWIGCLADINWHIWEVRRGARDGKAEEGARSESGRDATSSSVTVRSESEPAVAQVARPVTHVHVAAGSRGAAHYIMPGILGLCVLGVIWVSMTLSVALERSGATPVPRWAIPSGFSLSANPEVAYRWEEGGQCQKASCWHMTVVTFDGCPHSLYVELTTLAHDGTPVAYTNAMVGLFQGGEQAKLRFETTNESADNVRIAMVTCD